LEASLAHPKPRPLLHSALAALLIFSTAVSIDAKKDKNQAPPAPGKYEFRDEGMINRLEIKARFKLADYAEVRVIPADTANTQLPDKDENTHEPALRVLGRATAILVEGMQNELKTPRLATGDAPRTASAAVSAPADAASVPAAARAAPRLLLVRIRMVALDPGSRAARYWGGYDSGKTSVELEGDVRDSASGNLLLSFTVIRASGGALKIFGGRYERMMTRDIEHCGGDIGRMLAFFK
jgi:hypothetical protein